MSKKAVTLEEAAVLASRLSPLDRVRLVERVMSDLERDLMASGTRGRRSLYGLCADLGPAPSAVEIDQARREAWADFPREDV